MYKKAENRVALYIHWPFCRKICPYCDFVVKKWRSQDVSMLPRVFLRDLAWQWSFLKHLDPESNHRISSVFFGGGTPSLMPASILQEICARLRDSYPLCPDAEITLEANPEDHACFASFAQAGIKRLSLGIQSLRETELVFLGRNHSASQALKAIHSASASYANWSVDLMYALPGQSRRDLDHSINAVLDAGAPHISAYALTIEPYTPFHQAMLRGDFVPAKEKPASQAMRYLQKKLRQAGYNHYELSNFAKPHHKSRHNAHYWRYGSYIGIGPGAHGRLHGPDSVYALAHARSVYGYRHGVLPQVEKLNCTQIALEMLSLGLRTARGVHTERFGQKCGYDLRRFLELDSAIHGADCFRLRKKSLRIRRSKWLYCDTLVSRMARYIPEKAPQ